MARKGENIRKRKDGRRERRYADGLTVKSVYAKTYLDVKQKLTEAKVYCSTNTFKCKKLFEDMINEWIMQKKHTVKKSSYIKYYGIINKHILPFWKGVNISDISDGLIFEFFDKKTIEENLSRSMIKSIYYVLNSTINYINKYYHGNIKINYELPKTKYAEPLLFNEKEMDQILSSIINSKKVKDLGILLSALCGLRIGEVCALQWQDIDLENGFVYVKKTVQRIKADESCKTKTKLWIDTPKSEPSIRQIPLTSFLKMYLSKFVNEFEQDNYVISGSTLLCEPRLYQYYFANFLNKEKITIRNYHVLRHTFATRCVESGVDVKTLSEILGHSTVNITLNKYVHPSMEQKRFQMEKLNYRSKSTNL